MSKIKVVVVDDSAFMRKAMEGMLSGESDIEIVGYGKNGKEAVELAKTLKPDVMTLDIEMPIMDGLQALDIIMKESPIPVIMVSSLTQEGADTTLKALDKGAVDFIPKEKSFGSVGILKISDELKAKVRRFANDKSIVRRLRPSFQPSARPAATAVRPGQTPGTAPSASRISTRVGGKKVVGIGTSTGGPQSLQKVIPALPGDIDVPILVVQHMPPNFTASLANRLNNLSKLTVLEAQGGELVQPNHVYIAKGGYQMVVKKSPRGVVIELKPEDPNILHNPSVDVMIESMCDVYGRDMLGVIMTGMGNDGTRGLKKLKAAGGAVVAQDEASCIVYGMPRAVVEADIADDIVPLDDIAGRIEAYCRKQ